MTRRADGADCTNTAGGSEMKEFLPKSAAKMADCLMTDDEAGIRDAGAESCRNGSAGR